MALEGTLAEGAQASHSSARRACGHPAAPGPRCGRPQTEQRPEDLGTGGASLARGACRRDRRLRAEKPTARCAGPTKCRPPGGGATDRSREIARGDGEQDGDVSQHVAAPGNRNPNAQQTWEGQRGLPAQPSPPPRARPGPARPGPQPQTPTYCQPLQALAMLRWDGVPTREGRHVRGAVARQPHLRVARETWLVCRASDGSCGQGCAARGQRRGAVSGGIHTEGGGEVGRLRTGTWWVVTELSGRRSGDIPH